MAKAKAPVSTELNPHQLQAILEICHAERLYFTLRLDWGMKFSAGVHPTDSQRSVQSAVRPFNRFSTDPSKALGRVHELLAERHLAVPEPVIDGEALAKALSELVALSPTSMIFIANFYQRGLQPYFRVRVGATADAQGNDAAAVAADTLAQLKAQQAAKP